VTLELELLLRQQRHDPAGDANTADAPCCSKAQCYISALSCIAFCPRCSSCPDVLLHRLQIVPRTLRVHVNTCCYRGLWVVFGWNIAGHRHFACRRLLLAPTELQLYRLLLLWWWWWVAAAAAMEDCDCSCISSYTCSAITGRLQKRLHFLALQPKEN
jgi:hypothetical protein